jgi:hypothetical protein
MSLKDTEEFCECKRCPDREFIILLIYHTRLKHSKELIRLTIYVGLTRIATILKIDCLKTQIKKIKIRKDINHFHIAYEKVKRVCEVSVTCPITTNRTQHLPLHFDILPSGMVTGDSTQQFPEPKAIALSSYLSVLTITHNTLYCSHLLLATIFDPMMTHIRVESSC